MQRHSKTAPDVVGATATQSVSDGTWTFSVTVSSPYETGWDKYADAWEVRGNDGAVYGTRLLLHPHVDEQPFTRSLSGVVIPQDVTEVVIAARDSVAGYCGDEFTLELSRMESTPAPPPTAAIANVQIPAPPSCEQEKVCTFEFSINVEGSESTGTISDHTIVLGNVTLIHSIEIEIASTFGEDIFIILGPPIENGRRDEYVLMEDTRTLNGTADFDLGKLQADASLSNVAPYIFVEDGGLDFTAPYSPPNVYTADTWGNGNHERVEIGIFSFLTIQGAIKFPSEM